MRVEWDEGGVERRSTDEPVAQYRALAEQPGKSVRAEGDAAQAIAGAARRFEATYEMPYLAHAPMEPLDCVARLTPDGGAELLLGSQVPTWDQRAAAAALGLPPHKVQIRTQLAGGSFGRRATPDSDVAHEAASILKAIGGRTPVKVVWTREDGRVRQSNFDDYPPLRIEDMPQVEVHIAPSGNPPTGVGEPGVPPIAPAVANAYARLTGQRVRRLPFVQGASA